MFIQGLGHEVLKPRAVLTSWTASVTHPALVIMDVQLRGMYGDEVTARLKKTISTRNIPVIINSGWATACNVEERTHRALNAAAEEILYKPVQLPILRDILRSYLFA